ncbi:bifunctional prephenate dehydrogenase/3-phosphoshikimate 1-carboxyvinyltransferase [Endozoicomonas sp. Mp262]|uniref:bifunctional prephenate dehydrogenase/3-phosphoshikimate 1-carboxyvinyltransferase n=1 Tax=Endozoicomonas sp. Mp262 TaxID=2919499 RepID=UPI0021DABCF3
MADNNPESFSGQLSVLVVGLGLIGGSFARALRKSGFCRSVIGFDRQPSSIVKASELGIIDQGANSLSEGVSQADVIMLSVPMLAMEPLLKQLAGLELSGKMITDAGSCKGAFVKSALAAFQEIPAMLVPGHPIAGSEKSGVTAARDDLFVAHNVLLTPLSHTDALAVAVVKKLWEVCGARVSCMEVEHHDQVLALTSHLPHYLAFSLVDTLAGEPENQAIFRYAAGGFRDFTRIAGSDPVMWHDIALSNREAVLESIDTFSEGLNRLRTAIAKGDSSALSGIFERARSARNHFATLLSRRMYMASCKEKMQSLVAGPGGSLCGHLRVPGDKSISHRSIMLGALAEGTTVIDGFLEGEDAMATLQAFRNMGVVIEGPDNGRVVVHGVGMHGLKPSSEPLYLGNAGTAMRLMAGLMAAQSFDVTLTGDESLSGRPMKRVTQPLSHMGAGIETAEGGTPPLNIKGQCTLKGIHYDMPVASAQVQSCLLLAGMYARGTTSVKSPGIVRDHTNRMLAGFGYPVQVKDDTVSISGGGSLIATDIDVPADISSAAFFMVAASIAEGSDIVLTHVGINPTRAGVIEILKLMGADITLTNEQEVGGEPVADIRVKSAPLKGIEIPRALVPVAIDEFPVLFVAAACANGRTVLRGAEELRVKESDRIQSMADGLQILGVEAKPLADGMIIHGSKMSGGTVDSCGDHRIAMAFAVAALKSEGEIRILDCANVATSFPNFVMLAEQAGMTVSVEGSNE